MVFDGVSHSPAPKRCPICRCEGPFALEDSHHDPLDDVDYDTYRCGGCSVIFSNPFRNPGAGWYERFSSPDSYEGIVSWRFDWFLSLGFRPGGRLLDVGCGTGNFLVKARAAGYQVCGIDFNAPAAQEASNRGLQTYVGSFTDFAATQPESSFDVITLYDVIEHLDDPVGTVDLAKRLLKPGGGLMISVPNGLLPTPFGRSDFEYPPYHLTLWRPESLVRFLEQRGFKVVHSYHTHLSAFAFSRHFIGPITKRMLAVTKSLLYGRKAETGTLTQLMTQPSAPNLSRNFVSLLLAPIKEKGTRTRLVRIFEDTLGWIVAPLFLPMKLYYRLTVPMVGSTCCVLACKA